MDVIDGSAAPKQNRGAIFSGTVHTLGSSPRERADILSRVGFVAQDVPLYRGFTVRAMLEFGRRNFEPG